MTDNPLVETVGAKLRATLEYETGVLMTVSTSAILATAALRAIEDAGYTITPTAAPSRAD